MVGLQHIGDSPIIAAADPRRMGRQAARHGSRSGASQTPPPIAALPPVAELRAAVDQCRRLMRKLEMFDAGRIEFHQIVILSSNGSPNPVRIWHV
jgi:hypothetical protein